MDGHSAAAYSAVTQIRTSVSQLDTHPPDTRTRRQVFLDSRTMYQEAVSDS